MEKAMELSLSVVIHLDPERVNHEMQVAILQEATAAAIAKFIENGELALDENLNFSFITSANVPVEAWLTRSE